MKRTPTGRPGKKRAPKKAKKHVEAKTEGSSLKQIEEMQKLTHLFQVNLVELEHQNQELRITEEELEASRNKYVNLFDFSPIPYFTLDPAGIIKEMNLRAGTMLGSYRNNLIGRDLHAYIPQEDKKTLHAFLNAVFNSSEKQSCQLRLISKDKSVFHVLLKGLKSADAPESDQRCQIALIDLTEYKKLEEAFRAVSEELKLLKTTRETKSTR